NQTTFTISTGGQTVSLPIQHGLPPENPSVSSGTFSLLPSGLSPVAVSPNGVVLMEDGSFYYRWHLGQLLQLDPIVDTWQDIGTSSKGGSLRSDTEAMLGADGSIVVISRSAHEQWDWEELIFSS